MIFQLSWKVLLTEGGKTLSLNLEQKKAVVGEVSEQVANAQAIILAEYRGLQVGEMTELRAKARKSGVYLRVLKNTLVRRAVDGTPFSALADKMVGPLVFGISSDPVSAAKVLSEFAKENESFVIKAGAMPNQVMDAQAIKPWPPCLVVRNCWRNFSALCKHLLPNLCVRLMRYQASLLEQWLLCAINKPLNLLTLL